MEQKTRVFCSIDVQEFHLGPECYRVVMLAGWGGGGLCDQAVPLESFSEQLITYFLFGKYSSPDKANKHEMKENFRSRFTVVAFPTHFLSLSGLGYIVLSQLLFRASNFIVFPPIT
jgi:hypothetical protein